MTFVVLNHFALQKGKRLVNHKQPLNNRPKGETRASAPEPPDPPLWGVSPNLKKAEPNYLAEEGLWKTSHILSV